MDLGLFARLVAESGEGWRRLGIATEFDRGPSGDEQAAWVDCETEWSTAKLFVWASGEADLIWSNRLSNARPNTQHYELTSALSLMRCLDDLTRHLLTHA